MSCLTRWTGEQLQYYTASIYAMFVLVYNTSWNTLLLLHVYVSLPSLFILFSLFLSFLHLSRHHPFLPFLPPKSWGGLWSTSSFLLTGRVWHVRAHDSFGHGLGSYVAANLTLLIILTLYYFHQLFRPAHLVPNQLCIWLCVDVVYVKWQ